MAKKEKWCRLVEVRRHIDDPDGWYINPDVPILGESYGESEFKLDNGTTVVKWVCVEVEM